MHLTDRLLKAWAGTMIPLRLFMGVQMLVYAVAYFLVPPVPGGFYEALVEVQYGWLWLLGMGAGGTWMLFSASIEGWLRVEGVAHPWRNFPTILRIVSNSRFYGYFFSGCVWFGVTFNLWVEGTYQITSMLGPVFVIFISWAAVNDATQRRKYCARNVDHPFAHG